MGVEIFRTALDYKRWAKEQHNIRVVKLVVFNGELVVTWEVV